MSFSVFEKIDPSCQNGSMEKAKNLPYHQRPYASIAERTLVDISIYSPRPQIAGTGHSHSKISIHSPRAGRDGNGAGGPQAHEISIHSPRMGRDKGLVRPARAQGISIHSPRMGRDAVLAVVVPFLIAISIHSPRMGRDMVSTTTVFTWAFQSTLPAWGETRLDRPAGGGGNISIHSPRMGRDGLCRLYGAFDRHFNPLSPHGERPGIMNVDGQRCDFNPLSPHGERR